MGRGWNRANDKLSSGSANLSTELQPPVETSVEVEIIKRTNKTEQSTKKIIIITNKNRKIKIINKEK